jgi:hypothetical protein
MYNYFQRIEEFVNAAGVPIFVSAGFPHTFGSKEPILAAMKMPALSQSRYGGSFAQFKRPKIDIYSYNVAQC